ncbi:flavin reductase family protein [Gordonia liuliyuniae]|uniref:Flavin reductase family protein n=1 Tax=Gordonia liuliyuniae TaxID=2911517 RepID=A0ABS9INM1_9ACTN|nr:flavin reductase family protein [Gordonia liuliyuniae]MCF8587163.1 flavin reductase family protein [Gordonia liuliyuniae]
MSETADATGAFDALVAVDRPLYVVTTRSADGPSGCLVGFATQTSIDPPRFFVGISRANHTHGVAANANHLAVHLIAREHAELARLFGGETGDSVDKFAACQWVEGPHDLPVLTDAGVWFVGRVIDRIDVGDHTGYLLAPVAGEVRHQDPELSAWVSLAIGDSIEPGHSA